MSLFKIDHPLQRLEFSKMLFNFIHSTSHTHSDIIFLCIGTDRVTGDSLGPLIGHKLTTLPYPNIHIHGTLESPVHAKNLNHTISSIYSTYSSPYIIAIDACLGKTEHIGMVTLNRGSLHPGSGVKKNLPEVGDLSITGIVNFCGFMDLLLLQNTRLHLIMNMADFISLGIKSALWKLNNAQKTKLVYASNFISP